MSSLNVGAITVTAAPHSSERACLAGGDGPAADDEAGSDPRRRGTPGRGAAVSAAQSWSRGGPTMPAAIVAKLSSSMRTKLPVMRSAS